MIDKELFDLFMKKRSDFELCEQIESLITKRVYEAIGKENAEFYSVLVALSNSINNVGWEERHSAQIGTINRAMGLIEQHYGKYLP
jgi:hypothetical protein